MTTIRLYRDRPGRSLGRLLIAARAAFGLFASARGGVAIVEFAVVLPVALILYIGAAEVSDAVMTSRKLDTATRTLVDLLSHQSTTAQPGPNPTSSSPAPQNAISSTTLATIMSAAATDLAPEPTGTLTMTLTAVDIYNQSNGNCCQLSVRWSYTQNGSQQTLRPCGVNAMTSASPSSAQSYSTFSSALLPSGTPLPGPVSVIIVDVAYTYQPVWGATIMNIAPVMRRTEYMLPRSTGQVIATGLTAISNGTGGTICY